MNTSACSWFGNASSADRKIIKHILLVASVFVLAASAFADDFPCKLSYSVDRGFYTDPFNVILSTDTTDAVIKYTLDGSDPSQSSTAKSADAPVSVYIDPENTTDRFTAPGVCLRSVVFVGGTQVTRVKTHTYLFVNQVTSLSPDGVRPGSQWPQPNKSNNRQYIDYGMDPDVYNDSRYRDEVTDALLAIPTFSIVTDLGNLFDSSTGIYVNASGHGEAWERPASIELLCPDGTDGFQVNAGLRIRGGYSRNNFFSKHSFRLFFKEKYGDAQLEYPLFGDEGADEFDKVDLRTSQNYSWANKGEGNDSGEHNTMLREVFSRDTQRDMGMPYTRSRYYHLYLNGVYWGLYQTQERSEAEYAETYFGGASEDYDVIKKSTDTGLIEAGDGNTDAYYKLWEIASNDFTTDEDYYKVQGLNPDGTDNPDYPKLVDLDNLICYMISIYYTGDYDAPISAWGNNQSINNIFAIYNRAQPDGFKFFRHDAEHTLFLYEGGMPGSGIDRTGPYSCGENRSQFNPQWLHQQLTHHPEYLIKFSDWVYKLFFNNGLLTPNAVVHRLKERKSQIETAIIAESARWGDCMVSRPRTYDNDWVPAVEFLINEYAPVRTEMVLEQFIAQGWYSDVPVPKINQASGIVDQGTNVTLTSDEGTVYYTLDGTDPHQAVTAGNSTTYTLVEKTATKYALVPTSDIGQSWYTDLNYHTNGWSTVTGAPGGIGYEGSSGFESYISLDVSDQAYDPSGSNPSANTGCYVRIPFIVTSDLLAKLTSLKFSALYDDGIAVYLNGNKILEENVPTNPVWNSVASSAVDSESDEKSYDVSSALTYLKGGDNLLSIHLLNTSRESSDFLILPRLTASDQSFGSEIASSAIAYSGGISIDKSVVLKSRTLGTKGWSALAEATFWVLEDVHELRISEIHYHPLDEGDDDNDSDYEFIELQNMGTADYDLSGLSFTSGITYSFPYGTQLDGGGYYVIASNDSCFQSRYGFAPDGIYTGKLDNSGENLVLRQANGDTLIHIRYNDKYPWPISADGEGYSLVVKSVYPGADLTLGENWTRSNQINGSPKGEDLATAVVEESSSWETTISSFHLFQNYPNPFNPTTTIRFRVAKEGYVRLTIHNVLGQEVAWLADGKYLPGEYQVCWNAIERAAGLYFCRIETDGFVATKKLMLVK